MTSLSRWCIYLGSFGATFAIGSFLIPSANGIIGKRSSAETANAQQSFWKEQFDALATTPAASTAARQEAVLGLLDKLKPGDFQKLLPALRSDTFAFPLFAALWSQVDRDSLFHQVATTGGLSSPENQTLASFMLMEQCIKDTPGAEAAASRLRQPGEKFDSFKPIAIALLRINVHRGAAFLAKHSSAMTTEEVLAELRADDAAATNWPEKSIEERINWLDGQPPVPWRNQSMEALYAKWATENPEAVLLAAQQRGASAQQILPAVKNWLTKSPDAVAKFYKEQAKDEVKAAVAVALAERQATTDPQAAWDFARWELSGQPRSQASQKIIQALSVTDPAAAAHFLANIPHAPWYAQAIQAVAQKWNEKDPVLAQEWLTSLPDPLQKLIKGGN